MRAIDADHLRRWILSRVFKTQLSVADVIDQIDREDTIELQPEIIRCKDCEHWDTTWQNDFAPNYHYCPLVDGTRRDDFYCADAEMRGEQDEKTT